MAKAKSKAPLGFNRPQTGMLTGKSKHKERERDTKNEEKGPVWAIACFAVFSGVGLLVEMFEDHPDYHKP